MNKPCPGFFEKAHERPGTSREIFRSDKHGILAILDIRPVSLGHTLIIPRECLPTVDELDTERHSQIFLVAKHVGHRIMDVMGEADDIEYVGTMVAGYQVPHAHVHRAPAPADDRQGWMRRFSGLEDRLSPSNDVMDDIRERLAFPPELAAAIDSELCQV